MRARRYGSYEKDGCASIADRKKASVEPDYDRSLASQNKSCLSVAVVIDLLARVSHVYCRHLVPL